MREPRDLRPAFYPKAVRLTSRHGSSKAWPAGPDKTLRGGKAHAEKPTDLVAGAGSAKRTITLWSATGIYTLPGFDQGEALETKRL
jgi:hypothetical protein